MTTLDIDTGPRNKTHTQRTNESIAGLHMTTPVDQASSLALWNIAHSLAAIADCAELQMVPIGAVMSIGEGG